MNRVIRMFTGVTISAFGIACVLNSDLGCFVETATYKGVSIRLGIPLFIANIICELIMISIAKWKGEGLGWTAIVNATYGAIMINLFHELLPHMTIMWLGGFLVPIGWSILEKARFGATGSNILMKALMKTTGKSLLFIRTIIEITFLITAWLLAPQYVTWFTITVTFGVPIIMTIVYKLIHYKPTEIEHEFIM